VAARKVFFEVILHRVISNITSKKHLPEDDQNRWSKQVACYADCDIINLYICTFTCWLYLRGDLMNISMMLATKYKSNEK
jgi:hypothetical protein